MQRGHLFASICTLSLLAAMPAMAQQATSPAAAGGTQATTPTTGPAVPSGSTAPSSKMTHRSTHAMHMQSSHAMGSAQDNMANQLNGESLQAAQQGHPFAVGSSMSAPGTSTHAPQGGHN